MRRVSGRRRLGLLMGRGFPNPAGANWRPDYSSLVQEKCWCVSGRSIRFFLGATQGLPSQTWPSKLAHPEPDSNYRGREEREAADCFEPADHISRPSWRDVASMANLDACVGGGGKADAGPRSSLGGRSWLISPARHIGGDRANSKRGALSYISPSEKTNNPGDAELRRALPA